MTAPANKKRTHNPAARAASIRMAGGGAERVQSKRKSPQARKLEVLRIAAAIKEQIAMGERHGGAAPSDQDDAATATGAKADASKGKVRITRRGKNGEAEALDDAGFDGPSRSGDGEDDEADDAEDDEADDAEAGDIEEGDEARHDTGEDEESRGEE
jgi:hypothetical protein